MSNPGYNSPHENSTHYGHLEAHRDAQSRKVPEAESYQQPHTTTADSPYFVTAPMPCDAHGAGQPEYQYAGPSHEPPYNIHIPPREGRYDAHYPSVQNLSQQARQPLHPEQRQARGFDAQERGPGYIAYSGGEQPQSGTSSLDSHAYESLHSRQTAAQTHSLADNAESSRPLLHGVQPTGHHGRHHSSGRQRPPSTGGHPDAMRQVAPRDSTSPLAPQLATISHQAANAPLPGNAKTKQHPIPPVESWSSITPSHSPPLNQPRPASRSRSQQMESSNARSAPTSPFGGQTGTAQPPMGRRNYDAGLPLSMDPSRVFDQAEYLRRKQAAEREANKARQNTTSTAATLPTTLIEQGRSSNISRDELQNELRSMFGKVRKYKFKDPTLYFDALEQLRGVRDIVEFATAANGQQEQIPRPSQASQSERNGDSATSAASPPTLKPVTQPQGAAEMRQLSSPKAYLKHPDPGKFPAQHRQRRPNMGIPRNQPLGAMSTESVGTDTDHLLHSSNRLPPELHPPLASPPTAIQAITGAFANSNNPSTRHKTIWPEAKRLLLASTAVEMLSKEPLNKGKSIAMEMILEWLHENPTYDDLCTRLYSRDLHFDKAAFARHLLTALSSEVGPSTNQPPAMPPTTDTLKRKRELSSVQDAPSKKATLPSERVESDVVPQVMLSTGPLAVNPTPAIHPPPSEGSCMHSETVDASARSTTTPAAGNSPSVGDTAASYNAPKIADKTFKSRRPSQQKPLKDLPMSSTIAIAKATKEEMAGKPNFSEIIDLSQLDDSSDDKEIQLPPLGFDGVEDMSLLMEGLSSNLSGATVMPPTIDSSMRDSMALTGQGSARATSALANQASHSGAEFSAAISKLRHQDLCENLSWSKALRKSAYDPATIARDFLIARGEHLTERPLNFHLMPLLHRFASVNFKSDLSTFRWDLVDPGVPVEPPKMPVGQNPVVPGPGAAPFHHPLITQVQEAASGPIKDPRWQVAQRSNTTPKASPVPQVAASITPQQPGRRPSQTPVDSRSSRQGTPSDETGDSQRGGRRGRPPKYGLARAGVQARKSERSPAPLSRSGTRKNTPPPGMVRGQAAGETASSSRGPINPPANHGDPSTSIKPPQLEPYPTTTGFVAVNAGEPSAQTLGSDETRTAPKEPSISELADRIYANIYEESRTPKTPQRADRMPPFLPTSKRRGRRPNSAGAASGNFFSHMNRESSAEPPVKLPVARRGRARGSQNGPFSRKPGRPAKEKPSKINTTMPADGIGVMILPPSPSSTPRAVSYIEDRPPVVKKTPRWKAHPTYPEYTPDSNAYASFKCRWIGCKAELHNLDTLRKHISKLHKSTCYDEQSRAYSCFWNDCEKFDAFSDPASWERHIETVHLDPIARELGDGPTTHPAAPNLDYLKDADGCQVTPTALTLGRPDPLPLHAGRSPTRAYHKVHGNITPEQKARAERISLRYHAMRAAEARSGGDAVNRTAEWRSSRENTEAEADLEEEGDDDDRMEE